MRKGGRRAVDPRLSGGMYGDCVYTQINFLLIGVGWKMVFRVFADFRSVLWILRGDVECKVEKNVTFSESLTARIESIPLYVVSV